MLGVGGAFGCVGCVGRVGRVGFPSLCHNVRDHRGHHLTKLGRGIGHHRGLVNKNGQDPKRNEQLEEGLHALACAVF